MKSLKKTNQLALIGLASMLTGYVIYFLADFYLTRIFSQLHGLINITILLELVGIILQTVFILTYVKRCGKSMKLPLKSCVAILAGVITLAIFQNAFEGNIMRLVGQNILLGGYSLTWGVFMITIYSGNPASSSFKKKCLQSGCINIVVALLHIVPEVWKYLYVFFNLNYHPKYLFEPLGATIVSVIVGIGLVLTGLTVMQMYSIQKTYQEADTDE